MSHESKGVGLHLSGSDGRHNLLAAQVPIYRAEVVDVEPDEHRVIPFLDNAPLSGFLEGSVKDASFQVQRGVIGHLENQCDLGLHIFAEQGRVCGYTSGHWGNGGSALRPVQFSYS